MCENQVSPINATRLIFVSRLKSVTHFVHNVKFPYIENRHGINIDNENLSSAVLFSHCSFVSFNHDVNAQIMVV